MLIRSTYNSRLRYLAHQSLKTGIGDVVDIKIKLDQNSINSIISKLGIPDLNNIESESTLLEKQNIMHG